ncbi:hypothetical protein M9H77_33161 [Catharanthus roseus]|uniref:Uncharacterized protein n=1 Tax=Catharanthus roseus TaxID=4058 RepID=A0ACB9ZK18_CATRO|nr:hypothetical protein M9H77_33161 [Catharanthus roseus]
MKDVQQKPSDEEEEEGMNVWDCGSPLYDSYELVSLGHVIDRHTMILPSLINTNGSRSSSATVAVEANAPSSSSSAIEGAPSKKLKGSAFLVFLSKLMEKKNIWNWKRRICTGEIK